MKRLLICLVAFFITATILYAQPRGESSDRYPQAPGMTGEESFQTPKAIGEEEWQWIKEEFPEKYEKLMQLKEKNPQGFEKEGMQLRRLVMLRRLKTEDPEAYAMSKKLFELEEKAAGLAEEYKKESSLKQKEKIKGEIQGALNEAFDLKLTIEERKLNGLKDKLSELEKSLEKRKSNRDEIIGKHLEGLLQEEDSLRW